MFGLTAKITKGLSTNSVLNCDDNSGAKKVVIVGVKGVRNSRARRNPSVGVANIVVVYVRTGKRELMSKKQLAVITRQKKEYRRGLERVKFEDNACVLVNEDGLPVGTEIKGCVAREVAERFPKVVTIAQAVV
jgi:large subunit ribosomal protein L14